MSVPPSLSLQHLTLDRFVYDLHDGLGETAERIQERREHFWQRLYPNGLPNEKLPFLAQVMEQENQDSNYIELLGSKRYLQLSPTENGYFLPVLLGDTYLTLIDSSGEMGWKGHPQPIENLKLIRQSEVFQRQAAAEIGESWLIFGQLTADVQDQDLPAIAQRCYEALALDASWDSANLLAGHWQGATLFERWHNGHHVLIVLFPPQHPNVTTVAGKLQRQLAYLLSFRHKILWTYQQSRKLKTILKESSSKIQAIVDRVPSRLTTAHPPLQDLQTDLAEALQLFALYSEQLSYLEEQQHTIEINITNYERRLEQMQKMATDADLPNLKAFAIYAREKYLSQLGSDYRGLGAGLRLLENTISTLSGVSQLEQTKRDRRLSETVAVAGVWVGTASATASLITPVTTRLTGVDFQPSSTPPSLISVWTTFGLSLLLSLGIGLVAAILWKGLQRFDRGQG